MQKRRLTMGIDLATWRARIGLNYYHMSRPLQTRCRSIGDQLYQPGVASWGVGEVMNDTPPFLKGCISVVALSLILQYVVRSWSQVKGRGRSGKVRCHWRGSISQVRATVDSGGTLLLRAIVVVIPLLLVIAGDVETNPGPGEPSLGTLLNELHPVCARWYNIGLQLNISHTKLDCFRQIYSDPSELMREMLKYWLNTAINPRPTWKAVVTALRSRSVDEQSVAEQLESKYCISAQPVMHEPNSPIKEEKSEGVETHDQITDKIGQSLPDSESPTASAAQHNSNTSPPSSEGSQRTPFGCGCGKCTFFSFIEGGCPTPLPSASSFPYLDLSGLTHEQQQELRGRLRFESQKIMLRFQELVSATIKSLKRRYVPPDELVSHVMALGAFDPVYKESQEPVFRLCFKELQAADTIPRVFMILNDYFSFFNYHIIEHIIKTLGTKKDKARLRRYKEGFNRYAKRRIFECLPEFGPVSDVDNADIFVKLDSQYDNYTVAQIEGFRHKLSGILRLSSKGILRLCRVDKGCFQLMFQVPSFVQHEIFPLSKEQERALAAMGVIRLTCGNYQFKKDEPQTKNENGHQRDADDDSGMGPSTFTDTKSTTFSEDRLDKELKELDYELKVRGLVETASSHKSGSGLELHYAVAFEQLEYVKLLVEKEHCNPLQRNQNGFTAFHVAAIEGNVEVLKYFITECNCNPACLGPLGLTPLHLASEQGHVDVVKYLVIEQQMEPLCEDEYGNTPLHRACAGGCQAVVEFLTSELEKYIPITELVSDLKNKWKSTPLHCAVNLNSHLGILQFFISDQNCDPNLPGLYGRTLLHYASQFGHLHIVKYLIDEQACNPSCLDEYEDTPLHCAAMKGHVDVVKFLTVEKHCDSSYKDVDGFTPLHMAIKHGHLDVVQFFVSNQNCHRGQYDRTPLHTAAEFGHLHIVKYLTDEQGCDPSSLDEDEYTPLHCAAMKGHVDIVKFLTVEKHCDPMCRDSEQYSTPLHMAAYNGHKDVVKFLIVEMQCDPTSRNAFNSTPLHLAATKGHLDIIQFFTSDLNCDPNILGGPFDVTPLHAAAAGGHLKIVKFLVEELKCPPDIQGQHYKAPLQMAKLQGHSDIVRYLQKHSVIPYIYTAITMMKQLGLLK